MRHKAAGFGVAAALAAGVALSGLPAAAHSSLIGSTPEDGAVLDEAPDEVVLEFDSDIQPDFTQVAVLDAGENHYEDGEPESAGSTVTQPVTAMPAGEYSISYRAGSADGHPVTGVVSFSVDASPDGVASEEAADEPAGGATAGAATAGTEREDGTPTESVVAAVAAVALVGTAGVFLLRRRPGAAGDDEAPPSPQ